MLVSSPGGGNADKYEAWYSLLEKELGLVAKPEAQIISIGARVGRFLSDKGLYGHAGTIPHYSNNAARYFGKESAGKESAGKESAGKESAGKESAYQKFSEGLDSLPQGARLRLSESRKKLMFDYKIRFERIREQERSGWPFWQQEWQRRMAVAK